MAVSSLLPQMLFIRDMMMVDMQTTPLRLEKAITGLVSPPRLLVHTRNAHHVKAVGAAAPPHSLFPRLEIVIIWSGGRLILLLRNMHCLSSSLQSICSASGLVVVVGYCRNTEGCFRGEICVHQQTSSGHRTHKLLSMTDGLSIEPTTTKDRKTHRGRLLGPMTGELNERTKEVNPVCWPFPPPPLSRLSSISFYLAVSLEFWARPTSTIYSKN